MSRKFAALVLSHGRATAIHTVRTIRRCGYTGDIFIVVDDEDKTLPEYITQFGKDKVLVFSKKEVSKTFDEGDNFDARNTVTYARNACWELAKARGLTHFIQLDDDYTGFHFRYTSDGEYIPTMSIKCLDALFELMCSFLDDTGALTVCMSQGGDHLGGHQRRLRLLRKAMNTFVCRVDKPIEFVGRINDDVSTPVLQATRGQLMFTFLHAMMIQKPTQSGAGGMSSAYQIGTFTKSFYSVMMAPSCVKISTLADGAHDMVANLRIHHEVNWSKCAPKIVHEKHRKQQ